MRKILLSSVSVLAAGYVLAGAAEAQTAAAPAPGTIVVSLGGRFRAFVGTMAQGDGDGSTSVTSYTDTSKVVTSTTAKVNDAGVYEYLRLYPGFDGLTTTGIKYGVNTEIRQDNVAGAGGGSVGSVSAQDRALGAAADLERRIERSPLTAVLIAAGVGMALGMLSKSRG